MEYKILALLILHIKHLFDCQQLMTPKTFCFGYMFNMKEAGLLVDNKHLRVENDSHHSIFKVYVSLGKSL